jgi:hypothetical protein
LFGAARDGGARHHEGVDIFAPRSTPVLAVVDGRAVYRENRLGGKTVWLNAPGASYYYAHLDRAAITGTERVRAGDVLGYVGNTGNAATTVPHLHFGVYRWGKGAIDPLPLLGAGTFREQVPNERFTRRYLRTTASLLNVRAGPSPTARVTMRLPRATIVEASALAGDWLRVRLVDDRRSIGFIHRGYQAALEPPSTAWRARSPTYLYDGIGDSAVPIEHVAVGEVFRVLAIVGQHVLIGGAGVPRPGWTSRRS